MTLNPLLPGLDPQSPLTDEDWFAKRLEISELFSPTAPVRESDLFAGRSSQIDRTLDAIFQAGQHVVVYGDRGVGKTSLINTVSQKIFSKSARTKFFPAQCYKDDDFIKIWERALKDHTWQDGSFAFDDIDDATDSDSLLKLILTKFNPNNRPVFIFDEFDRITDVETKLKMAETIKLFSDRSVDATIIIAGIARTIRDLLQEHESVKRALKQIEMPRMSPEEIREIVTKRLSRVGMSINPDALETIVWLARGMPGYAHLLGMYSAKTAIQQKRLSVDSEALFSSLQNCLDEAGESTRQAYSKATQSAKPNHLLCETLLACAIAPQDDFGSFTAAAVRDPISKILKRKREIPDFNRHLQAFCDEDRGPILDREGSPKNYRYRFIDPIMQSYVITKGVRERVLPFADAS